MQRTCGPAQVAAAEASYTDASSLKVTTTSTLRAQYASTSDTLGTLRMVIDMIVHNTSLGDNEVVDFLRNMMVAGEGSLETINETVVDKSSQYNAVMSSAGQEVRNLQEMCARGRCQQPWETGVQEWKTTARSKYDLF